MSVADGFHFFVGRMLFSLCAIGGIMWIYLLFLAGAWVSFKARKLMGKK